MLALRIRNNGRVSTEYQGTRLITWRQHGSLRRQTLLAVGLAAAVGVGALLAYAAYYSTDEGTLPRELVLLFLTLLLSAVGVTITVGISALALFTFRLREARLSSRIEGIRAEIVIGRCVIPDISVIAAPSYRSSCLERTLFEFEPGLHEARGMPPDWEAIESTVLPAITAAAASRRQTFDDGEIIDVTSAELIRGGPGDKNTYVMTAAPSSYYLWAATSARMDEGAPSLRESWEEWEQEILRLEDVGRAMSPCFAGVVVLVVTQEADGTRRLVLHQRGNVWVAGTSPDDKRRKVRRIHFVGEGVLPEDVEGRRISVHQTAIRGLEEELGLKRGDVTSLVMTGVAFDTDRRQPVFCFLAQTHLSYERVTLQARAAPGFFEANDFVPLVWSLASQQLRKLMTGSGHRLQLASNHAQIALLFALIYEFGIVETERAL